MTDEAPMTPRDGLAQADAEARLAAEGPNELPGGRRRSAFGIIGGVLREPMLLLLLAAGAIYLLLGDPGEALILLGFVGLTIGIAVVQEVRTEGAIEALRDLSMPQATVIRDGRRITIASREVVRGDLLVISEGSRISADGWIVEANGLQADEAILTGESVPVAKSAVSREDPGDPPLPGGDNLPYAFSGTLVVRGTGLARVHATGPHSRIGALGRSLASLETETPPLVLQTRSLVRWFAVAALAVSLLSVLLYGFLRGGWLDGLLSGIAVAMSLLPEELPVVLALFMTIGALRMARSRVLARRGSAIETLGAATVLCTDKTGTLTQNRMAVAELRLAGGEIHRPGLGEALSTPEFADLARLGMLASEEDPFDPMEKAFHDLASAQATTSLASHREHGWSMEQAYALAPELLAMSQVWMRGEKPQRMVAAKGAPEAIAELCRLDAGARQAMDAAVGEMARRGLRVLAVAEAGWSTEHLPETQRHFDFVYRGLVGLADPIRESVPAAVRQLQEAGIRVVMITGDYPATASAIAAQAGIAAGSVMTGAEIAKADDTELARQIRGVAVFARVLPEQKLRIVRALKSAGEIVAMTGDGVNDAPSLKAAHIGIAMGQRGTDVARAASALVLLDDDFGSIVTAVRLGRRIYDNIRKAAGFIFAVHLPIAGLAIAPLLFGWPLILGPVHIALLELIIDPTCSLVFEAEPEEPDVMQRRPRAPHTALISRALAVWSASQGAAALALLLGLAAWAQRSAMAAEAMRATVFAGLIAAVFVLVLVNRSFGVRWVGRRSSGHNWALAAILGLTAPLYALIVLVPSVARLFGFAVPGENGVVAAALVAAALAVMLAAGKKRFNAGLVG
uniref:cation-translocating P-type ATPase n=1 Tax=Altererythrobacter segetis TaxID=1104773 RepID=UPI001408A8F0|nr:cation-translocating P-type ATPase [Altererythrobacter segetis]